MQAVEGGSYSPTLAKYTASSEDPQMLSPS